MKSIRNLSRHQRGIKAGLAVAGSPEPSHRRRRAKARAIIAVLGLLLLSGDAVADEARGGSYAGAGLVTCSQFGQMYGNDPALTEAVFSAWMQGWLSGYNNALLVQVIATGKDARGKDITAELRPELGEAQIYKYLIDLWPAGFGPKEQWDFVLGFCSEAPLKTFHEAVANVQGVLREWPRKE